MNCFFTTDIDEKPKETALQSKSYSNLLIDLINKYSSLTRAKRVLAWIMRFITKARNLSTAVQPETAHTDRVLSTYLTTSELLASNNMIVKFMQRCEFEEEYKLLTKGKMVNNKSPIYKLNPYIDNEGILRVGGRLNKTSLPIGMKNPIILSRNGRLTQLVIAQAHVATLHGGSRLTLAYRRQRYWIIGGTRAVKNQLHHCVRCKRYKPTDNYQIMADLPPQRVQPSRPFTHTGVDFTGHVDVKLNKGRGVKT